MIRLTSSDETMLKAATKGGFHLATQWYFDWDPIDYQYVFHYLPIKNSTNVMGIGAGKAQPLTSRVLTPHGWRQMGELRVGDYVLAADGTPTAVLGVFPQGIRLVYRLTTNDGEVVRADEDHLWTIQRRAGRPFRNFATRELADLIQAHPPARNSHFRLPFTGIAQFASQEVSVDPYLLGLLLGDGSLSNGTPRFSSADPELLEYMAAAIQAFGLELNYIGQYDYRLSNPTGKQDNFNGLTRALRGLNLWKTHSHTKFIPREYIYNTLDVRLAILQGLFDTDGCASNGGVEYTTTSEQMAMDVQELVRSLGGHASINLHTARMDGQAFESNRLYITFRRWPFEPFRLRRKLDQMTQLPENGVGCFRQGVVAIEPDGKDETQCILVDHPDHLYITDGWVATHNTAMVSASYLMNCLTYPGFKALNASVTAKQAELAFEMVDAWLETHPRLNRFVLDKTLRPYPILNFANLSTFEFRTAGLGAKFIRGHEYDRINYDEASLSWSAGQGKLLKNGDESHLPFPGACPEVQYTQDDGRQSFYTRERRPPF